MSNQTSDNEDILIRQEGRCGFLTLNRPKALNALTPGMITTLDETYLKWAKEARIYGLVLEAVPGRAFCGGGDVRAMAGLMDSDPDAALDFFRREYQHNWTLQSYIKPHLSLIDGIVMGGGVGISLYGTHRIAGENLLFAMPETGIGFFPDIGGGYFLARFPGETGMYLGLTGNAVGRADAYYLGFATHCINSDQFDEIRAAMIEGDPIDARLDALHFHPGPSELEKLREPIDRIFSASSVEDILARLDSETGEHADWAHQIAATLRQKAPFSLKLTFRQIRQAARQPRLKEELVVEHRLVSRMGPRPDFREGVRAQLIDKDRSPKWQPATLEEVSEEMIAACFAPLEEGELELIDHWTLVD